MPTDVWEAPSSPSTLPVSACSKHAAISPSCGTSRVRPEARSSGTESLLFRAVEAWARDRSCHTLKVETQNTNVPACRFYRRMGCTLGTIDRFAYADLPDELQLMWFKEL